VQNSAKAPEIVRFGIFEVDCRTGELRKRGLKIRLQEQPLQILIMLLERPGEVVTRDEIQARLWPCGTIVEFEHSIATAIKKLRQALGDEAGTPRYVETLPRRGYRFIARIEEVHPLSPPRARAPASSASVGAAPVVDPRWIPWMLWTVLACVLAIVTILIWYYPRHSSEGKITLVVLPMDNLSGDPQQEYLADGITEEITTELGKLDPKQLGVLARTSAMQYKHSRKNTAQISRELGVTYLLEGSVRRSGGNVRITAQLIQSSDQTHVWAKSYDRQPTDILKVESDIAGIIAEEIRLRLPGQANERLAAAPRVNSEAHDAYLRGLEGWHQRSRDGFLQAITHFRHAAELDPNYAPAYAGLARVYSLAPIFASIPAGEAAPNAIEAANRALSLDETLADAHSAIGFVKAHYQYDWPGANRELRRAIELEPNNPYSHFFYSNSYLSPLRRHREAIAEMKIAMQLDPLSTRIQSFAGRTFICARRYNDALAQYKKVNQLDPNFVLNHARLVELYAFLGKYDEAIAEETKVRLLTGERPDDVVTKTNTLRQAVIARGAQGFWQSELRFSKGDQNPPEGYTRPYVLAIIYTHLGDKQRAFAALEAAYRERDEQMIELSVEPQFDSLRADPRFTGLERRIGIPGL
jgi:TolB-like protein/DNA-binding winged helix-turn-helix (wHTH) protein